MRSVAALLQVQFELKHEFVAQGLMLGEFHMVCTCTSETQSITKPVTLCTSDTQSGLLHSTDALSAGQQFFRIAEPSLLPSEDSSAVPGHPVKPLLIVLTAMTE